MVTRWAGVLLVTCFACDGYVPPLKDRARQIVAGPATPAGFGERACSHADPPAGDGHRWCAFFRPAPDERDRIELWAFDATAALAGLEVRCEGDGVRCLRVSERLWTGSKIGSPSHPEAQRFVGDTLVFLADPHPATEKLDRYEGGVWAWRPGWPEARRLTGPRGVLCEGNPRGDAFYCVENVVDMPVIRLDLTMGSIEQTGQGGLPTVENIVPIREDDIAWSAAFVPAGDALAYSSWRDGERVESLRVLPVRDAGGASRVVLEGITRWRLSFDGAVVYWLRDRQLGREETTFTLTATEFPGAAPLGDVATGVYAYRPLGAPGVDRGVAFMTQPSGLEGTLHLARDPRRPGESVVVEQDVHFWRPSTDGRFLYILQSDRRGERGLMADIDQGTVCRLGSRPGVTVYSVDFLLPLGLVAWSESVDAEDGGEMRSVFAGKPTTCDGVQTLGDVQHLRPVGTRGLVLGTVSGEGFDLSLAPARGGLVDGSVAELLVSGVGREVAPVGARPDALLVGTIETAPEGQGLTLVPLR